MGIKQVLKSINRLIQHSLLASALLCGLVVSSACQDKHIVRGYPDQYSGIGVELKIDTLSQQPLVERVLAGSPAEQAGVMVGDRIVAIDETPTKGLPFGEIVVKIRGKSGSPNFFAKSEDALYDFSRINLKISLFRLNDS